MPRLKPWTPERVAQRVRLLVDVHGAPNRFQLNEVAGDANRVDVLAVSRIARLQWWAVNKHLEGARLKAEYQVRQGDGCPAYITVAQTN